MMKGKSDTYHSDNFGSLSFWAVMVLLFFASSFMTVETVYIDILIEKAENYGLNNEVETEIIVCLQKTSDIQEADWKGIIFKEVTCYFPDFHFEIPTPPPEFNLFESYA